MQRNAIEPILGALVLVAAVAFLVFAYNKAGQRTFSGYALTARFSAIDGLETGSDVRIGGVKVGQVTDIAIDPQTYLAMVKLTVAPEIKLPTDSVASISTEGLLGGKYVGLEPGVSDNMLKPGGLITHTEASVSLEGLIGKFMYSGGGDSKSASANGGAAAPAGNAPAPSSPSHP
ncbi:MAG TPA: outer membrane lipid asymmetry maintenance protein MlaD [Alphaproteobacteria bacterium]|jgi:phospholipid/cholesterol/gamma-HCH transport system substrate-binding protein|nr:outer membrane lipid asymmetry maintenance protein MlaD [Alphaproteobacteria bacterium]